jgi:hypothetical protein
MAQLPVPLCSSSAARIKANRGRSPLGARSLSVSKCSMDLRCLAQRTARRRGRLQARDMRVAANVALLADGKRASATEKTRGNNFTLIWSQCSLVRSRAPAGRIAGCTGNGGETFGHARTTFLQPPHRAGKRAAGSAARARASLWVSASGRGAAHPSKAVCARGRRAA